MEKILQFEYYPKNQAFVNAYLNLHQKMVRKTHETITRSDVKMTPSYKVLRSPDAKVSQSNRRRTPIRYRSVYDVPRNASLLYEGAAEEYEDTADYLPRGLTVKGTVLA